MRKLNQLERIHHGEPGRGDTATATELSRRGMLKTGLGAFFLMTLRYSAAGCASRDDAGADRDPTLGVSGRPLATSGSDSRLPIIWLEAAVCTGCACSLLASTEPMIEALLPSLRLEFQETLMDRSGGALDRLLAAVAGWRGQYVLVVDGSVSYDEGAPMTTLGVTGDGTEFTAQQLAAFLAAEALAVVALGTCASFGGIPSAAPNPGRHDSIARLVPAGTPLARIPGCPPNPRWIVEPLTALLASGVGGLTLDALGRPLPAFANTVHDGCPRRAAFDAGDLATAPGDPTRCLLGVGCKGLQTRAACGSRSWIGTGSCIDANHPCIGCSSPGFPDARTDAGDEGLVATSPFYRGA